MSEPTALYRYFGEDDDLLYVGIANEPFRRMAQHRTGKWWWSEVARVEIERFETREGALDAERDAIKSERPAYNIVHNPARIVGLRVALYCDLCDERIDPGRGYLSISATGAQEYESELVTTFGVHAEPYVEGDEDYDDRDAQRVGMSFSLEELLDLAGVAEWGAYHYDHDAAPEDGDYIIRAERLTSITDLLWWNNHLVGRTWVNNHTNWRRMLAEAHLGRGCLRIESA